MAVISAIDTILCFLLITIRIIFCRPGAQHVILNPYHTLMKNLLIVSLLILFGCGGSGLTDEQRKALNEEMKSREIKKVEEEDVVTETFAIGKQLYQEYTNGQDSLLNLYEAKVYRLKKDAIDSSEKDMELLEAYNYSLSQGGNLSENVQRDGEEMIYTLPFVEEEMYEGIVVIRIPRKTIILNL